MNPLDLHGAELLLFFAFAAAASVGLSAMLRWLVRFPGSALSSAQLDALDPYAIAYLLGGAPRAALAALAVLARRGFVTMDDYKIVRSEEAPTYEITTEGAYRGIPREPDKLHPLEQAVLGQLREPCPGITRILDGVTVPCKSLDNALVARGLLSSQAHRLLVKLPLVLVVMIECGVGLVRGRPFAFLVVLAVGLCLLSVFRLDVRSWFRLNVRTRWTRRADAAVATLRMQNAALKNTTASAPEQATSSEVALSYALFGGAALGGSLAEMGSFLLIEQHTVEAAAQAAQAARRYRWAALRPPNPGVPTGWHGMPRS